jgi:gamma-glutamylcyclotransferase (GGCT)/AIG2-like uncharacterized protein YtfP
MARFLVENGQLLGRATYRGRLYRITHYPGVVPSRDPKETVVGDVFRLRDPNRVLRRLDIYEGCGLAPRKRSEYVREVVAVTLEAGGAIEAWTYLYNWPVKASGHIRSGDFLRR